MKAVRVGAFRGRDVRIELHTTSCGPFPQRGDRGLLIGRLETAGDGRPVFIAQLDSPARRKDRQKDRP